MTEQYADAVRAAIDAVRDMKVDDPLRPIAFQEVLRAALSGGGLATPVSGTQGGQRTVSPDQGPVERLAARLGVSPDEVAQVFDFADGSVNLTVNPTRLAANKAGATAQIALLVAAARQGGLGENETPTEAIRVWCTEFGRYDESNFAATLKDMRGDFVIGGSARSRTYRLTRPGFERARTLISSLAVQS